MKNLQGISSDINCVNLSASSSLFVFQSTVKVKFGELG